MHKFDPTANAISSRFWQLRDPARDASHFPIWIEDIRAGKIKLKKDEVKRGRSSGGAINPIDVRWEISTDEREQFMVALQLVMRDGEPTGPHARKRRPAGYAKAVSEGEPHGDDGAKDSDRNEWLCVLKSP